MKIFLNIIFLAIPFALTVAQLPGYRHRDSLNHQLSIATVDTNRALILADLAEAFRNTIADSALLYAHQSLSLARQIKFPKGEAKALLSISVVQRELGNFPKSLEAGFKALRISEDNRLIFEEQSSLIRIANVYFASKDFPKALTYYRMAENKLDVAPNDFSLATAQVFIGNIYEELNKFDSALYYEDLASQKLFLYPSLPPLYFRVLGNIQAKSGNNQLALKYYDQGIQAAFMDSDYRKAAPLFISVASLYKAMGRLDSAIYKAKQGLAYGQKLNYKNQIMEAAILLGELYEKKDIGESLRYYKIAAGAKDSMYGIEKVRALQSITFDIQEQQREIEKAQTAYQNKVWLYALLASLGVFFSIALILYRNNRYKQKANIVLKEQKQEIQNTLLELKSTQAQLIQSEKMASLGELTAGIAHEIQNPLNFMNNFSEVNAELIDELKAELATGNQQQALEIANSIKENEEKINHHGKRADAIVKGMLQHSKTPSGQKEPTNINALCDEYIRFAYHGMRAKDKNFNADFTTDFDESIGKINIIPQDIGRVLLNLYNNAFYALAEKKKQQTENYELTVSVETKKIGDKVEIKVTDNGNGIPQNIVDKIFQPFFTTKPTGQGTGLGLSLSYDIIKAHGGEIKAETKEGEGSEFVIQLHLNTA